ncbi:MAG TPA: heteromeric transposase endonuclease subunit TnsA [Gammaproteobacteria bacterium]|nr:heteromeric transposase endonuclease subunit TnsA [Gammaproteobacteria bacterium]
MSTPVRRIGITNRSVSGIVPGMGRYESSLERDFMEILRFDSNIKSFKPQPVVIDYWREDGSSGTYTPDGYFEYASHLAHAPILYEIKYRADFRENWKTLIPKFRAAKDYCLSRGWVFRVFTENEIRTSYLDNVKFLTPYKERTIPDDLKHTILLHLYDLKNTDADLLLSAICRDKMNRARLIPALWHLIAQGEIGSELTEPLTMRSSIWTLGCPE